MILDMIYQNKNCTYIWNYSIQMVTLFRISTVRTIDTTEHAAKGNIKT